MIENIQRTNSILFDLFFRGMAVESPYPVAGKLMPLFSEACIISAISRTVKEEYPTRFFRALIRSSAGTQPYSSSVSPYS